MNQTYISSTNFPKGMERYGFEGSQEIPGLADKAAIIYEGVWGPDTYRRLQVISSQLKDLANQEQDAELKSKLLDSAAIVMIFSLHAELSFTTERDALISLFDRVKEVYNESKELSVEAQIRASYLLGSCYMMRGMFAEAEGLMQSALTMCKDGIVDGDFADKVRAAMIEAQIQQKKFDGLWTAFADYMPTGDVAPSFTRLKLLFALLNGMLEMHREVTLKGDQDKARTDLSSLGGFLAKMVLWMEQGRSSQTISAGELFDLTTMMKARKRELSALSEDMSAYQDYLSTAQNEKIEPPVRMLAAYDALLISGAVLDDDQAGAMKDVLVEIAKAGRPLAEMMGADYHLGIMRATITKFFGADTAKEIFGAEQTDTEAEDNVPVEKGDADKAEEM